MIDYLIDFKVVQVCDLIGNQNWNIYCIKSDWCGVYNQVQFCCIQWIKVQVYQQCGGYCYWCVEICCVFKECVEVEVDNQYLQMLVGGN